MHGHHWDCVQLSANIEKAECNLEDTGGMLHHGAPTISVRVKQEKKCKLKKECRLCTFGVENGEGCFQDRGWVLVHLLTVHEGEVLVKTNVRLPFCESFNLLFSWVCARCPHHLQRRRGGGTRGRRI